MSQNRITIRNWDKWQTYRRDRGKPPWVKVYKRLLMDPSWVQLTDEQKGQLVTMWLLAGDRDGVLPTPPGWQGDVNVASRLLAKLGQLDSPPDLQTLEELGFIKLDVNVTSERRQDVNQTGRVMSAQGREGKGREGKGRESSSSEDSLRSSSSEEDPPVPAEEIVAHLNSVAGTNYRPTSKQTRGYIRARLNDGFSVDDIKAVCTEKARQWKGDPKFRRYLRPETLFRPTKFEGYLQEARARRGGPESKAPEERYPVGDQIMREIYGDDWREE